MIYMDNAATTKMAPEVLQAMLPYMEEAYGNASALYPLGLRAHEAIGHAREQIADALNAKPGEIYFTGSGTEADNWALTGVFEKLSHKGNHIITTAIEHHAILHTGKYLESKGCEVTYLKPDREGIISASDVERAIRPDTILISVMFANNEIGTLEPVRAIGEICHARGVLFHTDAVQAFGHIPIDVEADHIDLLSSSGHKLNGPKGTGFLYMRKGLKLKSFIHGGGQERGRRAGTENVAGIVGYGVAAQLAAAHMETYAEETGRMRDDMIDSLLKAVPGAVLNGSRTHRLPNNVNICMEGVDGEQLLLHLASKDICASAGSACSSGSTDPSHVLTAIGLTHKQAAGSLRFSLSHETTKDEVDAVVSEVAAFVREKR